MINNDNILVTVYLRRTQHIVSNRHIGIAVADLRGPRRNPSPIKFCDIYIAAVNKWIVQHILILLVTQPFQQNL